MSDTGRAAVFQGLGKPFDIKEFPVPEPRPGAIVVRVTTANICGSDLHFWRGDGGLANMLTGVIMGHEMTGIIHALGEGVSKDSLGRNLAVGDQVVYPYFHSCGQCRPCLRGKEHACFVGLSSAMKPCAKPPHFFGGYADYYYLEPGRKVFRVPEGLDEGTVAGANCALSQVLFGLEQVGFQMGETVVIQGAGGLGLYATAVANEMGAETIIVIDGVDARLKLAKELGASHTIDIKEVDDARARTKEVLRLTDSWGADVVVEVVGFPEVVNEGIRMLARGGRYLELGNITARATYKADPSLLVGPNRSIHGVSLYSPFTLKKAIDFLARSKGTAPLDKLFSHAYKLEDIDRAFEESDAFAKQPTAVTRASISMMMQ